MSKTELRRQSIYTWMLITFTAIMFFVMAHQSRAGTANWDGDNASGNFSFNNNWYGDVQPTWGFGNQLQFNYRNNASQTSIYWDYGTGNTWYDIDNITFMNTFAAPITWNGNGGGNSDEGGRDEFDDYAEELEASDIEGGASAHL